jgi:serine/threonine-protein kinase RsbW
METLKIQIPSLAENIRIVESFIDNVKEQFNIDDDMYGNIMVAITESVNNAILHGNKGDKTKNVTLSVSIIENRVVFTVKDEGTGFDPNNLPDPTAPENLNKIGGRGIFLMKYLCDQVKFFDEGRTVELSFIINA